MKNHRIIKGPAIELEFVEEIELTKIIANIINKYNYKCLAYNVCIDHVHLILVCEYVELNGIV